MKLSVLALLCAACTSEPVAWRIRFEDPTLEARAALVETIVHEGGCAGTNAIYRAFVRRGSSAPMPVLSAPGRFGLSAIARDASCREFARGCTELELPSESAEVVTVLRAAAEIDACDAGETCTAGVCTGELDAGMDAAARDAASDARAADGAADATTDSAAGCGAPSGAASCDPTPGPPRDCGDGVRQPSFGEECDDALDAAPFCNDLCQRDVLDCAACGNGLLEPANHEQCDDGNHIAADRCGPRCQYERAGGCCGDLPVRREDPVEKCDDAMPGDEMCDPTCQLTRELRAFTGLGLAGDTRTDLDVIGDTLWAADTLTDAIYRVDLSVAPALDTRHSGVTGLSAIATDGETVWFAAGASIGALAADVPGAVTPVVTLPDCDPASSAFPEIRGLHYDRGVLWAADYGCRTIVRIDPETGAVATVAGTAGASGHADGVGPAARFEGPSNLTSDGSGVLFVTDWRRFTDGPPDHVRAVDVRTGEVTTIATLARGSDPRGIATDGTSLFVVLAGRDVVMQLPLTSWTWGTQLTPRSLVGLDGTAGTVLGFGDDARLTEPQEVAYDYVRRRLFVQEIDPTPATRVPPEPVQGVIRTVE